MREPDVHRTPVDGQPRDLQQLELELLLEAINRWYGFDFRGYSPASLKRRLWRCAQREGLSTLGELQARVLHDPSVMEQLLLDLSINVTAMFRDPGFYRSFRESVVPHLRTWPYLRFWHAGCSTGEEVYSMAILLHEEGLLERSRIYATDMNEAVLERARAGVYDVDDMREYTLNYQRAGGRRSFSEYYTARYDGALFDPELTRNVVFARHNLATDASFNEFHVIVCRNVMIYFDRPLQNRVHDLFHDSLVRSGFLGLGNRESLRFTSHEEDYEVIDAQQRIYRRVD